jgi:hypothetical protein
MRSMVEGLFKRPKNPSTALRAVPLPRKAGGGIETAAQLECLAHRAAAA